MNKKILLLISSAFLFSSHIIIPMITKDQKGKLVKKGYYATGSLRAICEFTKKTREAAEFFEIKRDVQTKEANKKKISQEIELEKKKKEKQWAEIKKKCGEILDPHILLTLIKDKYYLADFALKAMGILQFSKIAKECAELCKAGRTSCACTNMEQKILFPLLEFALLKRTGKILTAYTGVANPIGFQQNIAYYSLLYAIYHSTSIARHINNAQIPQKLIAFLVAKTQNVTVTLNNLTERLITNNDTMAYRPGR